MNFLFVDYVQLGRSARRGEGPTGRLKRLTMSLNIPVVNASKVGKEGHIVTCRAIAHDAEGGRTFTTNFTNGAYGVMCGIFYFTDSFCNMYK